LEDLSNDFVLLAPSFYGFASYALVDDHACPWRGQITTLWPQAYAAIYRKVSLTGIGNMTHKIKYIHQIL
jgi:hypothetical protein